MGPVNGKLLWRKSFPLPGLLALPWHLLATHHRVPLPSPSCFILGHPVGRTCTSIYMVKCNQVSTQTFTQHTHLPECSSFRPQKPRLKEVDMVTKEWGSRRKVTRDSHAVSASGAQRKRQPARFISPHSHMEFWVWDPAYPGWSLSWMCFQLCDFGQVIQPLCALVSSSISYRAVCLTS